MLLYRGLAIPEPCHHLLSHHRSQGAHTTRHHHLQTYQHTSFPCHPPPPVRASPRNPSRCPILSSHRHSSHTTLLSTDTQHPTPSIYPRAPGQKHHPRRQPHHPPASSPARTVPTTSKYHPRQSVSGLT